MTTTTYTSEVKGKRSPLARGMLQMSAGRGAATVITLLTAPVLGRLFPPASYGALGVLSTLCGFLAAFATTSYVQALPLAAQPSERRALFVLCTVIMAAMTVVVTVGTVFGRGHLAVAFHEPQVAMYAWFLPPLFLSSAVKTLIDTTLSCERRFSAVSVRAVLDVAVTRFSQIGLSLAGLKGSPLGLFLGSMTGSMLAALTSGSTSVRAVLRSAKGPFQWCEVRDAAVKHRKFPLVYLWNQTINTVTLGLPPMILGSRFNLDTVAFYNMGTMMVGLPITLFAGASSQVFYVEAGSLVGKGQSAATVAQQLVRLISAVVAFPLTVVLMLGPMLFDLFLGTKWREAGVYAQILMPWMVFMAYANPLATLFLVFRRQGESFAYNLVLLGSRFCALYFGGAILDIRQTLGLFMLAGLLMNAWLVFRAMHLLGVGAAWTGTQIARAYGPPVALLIPATILYWYCGSTAGSLSALAAACGVHGILLHRRYPQILKQTLARLVRH